MSVADKVIPIEKLFIEFGGTNRSLSSVLALLDADPDCLTFTVADAGELVIFEITRLETTVDVADGTVYRFV